MTNFPQEPDNWFEIKEIYYIYYCLFEEHLRRQYDHDKLHKEYHFFSRDNSMD